MSERGIRGINGITDVAERHLCTGCGVCAFVQPDVIRMVDDVDRGRRPIVSGGKSTDTTSALQACPGAGLSHDHDPRETSPEETGGIWGPVLEVWEGYAADPEVRFAASSGGAASALALSRLETDRARGLLHIRARRDQPMLNETVMSTTRAEVLEATGSRYAPASPCDRLDLVEEAGGPCVMIGKPCDIAATARVRATRPALDDNLDLTVAIFCAGTPSLRGTKEMIESMGFPPGVDVTSVRYRGRGWPGRAAATVDLPDGSTQTRSLSYEESWGDVLQRHRQWRCYVCADHTGEFADISVGDPWYRDDPGEDPGRSLIVVRTERGRAALRDALETGHIVAEPVAVDSIARSQRGLLRVRGSLWGRLLVLRMMGVASPRYGNMPMFPVWWASLTWRQRLQSMAGMAKRVFTKQLYARRSVSPLEADAGAADGRTTDPAGDA